jgi:acetyl esterase/lipase
MKKLVRKLGFLSALAAALTLIRPKKHGPGWMFSKIAAGSWSPFAAAAGGLAALLGLFSKDLFAVLTGLFGAVVAGRHVQKVTAPHDYLFSEAFGRDWQACIPSALRKRFLAQRYSVLSGDPPPARWQQDVQVGTHVETGDPLLADIWEPPTDVPRTGLAVIYLHGSAWYYLDKDFGTRRFFQHLASQGHVILDLAYTLAPKAQLHAMVADVKRAIAWMKTNAAAYEVNPERIVLMGGSAGGHLALLSAYTPNHPEFQPADVEADTAVHAVVSYYAPVEMSATYRYFQKSHGRSLLGQILAQPRLADRLDSFFVRNRILPPYGKLSDTLDVIPGLLGGTPEQVPELYRLGSPIHHVGSHCPPTLLLQGAHDSGGWVADVQRLHRSLREHGVKAVYVEFPDTEHGFDLVSPKWAPAAQAATYDVERFLGLMV